VEEIISITLNQMRNEFQKIDKLLEKSKDLRPLRA
jgi:hypothetical protein